MSESEVARNCFNQLRWAIEQIANPEYQVRVWMGDDPDEKSSYLDASAEILDQDERFALIASHLAEVGLTLQQWSDVTEFSRTLQKFEDSVPHPYDSAEVLRQPGWKSIVSHARAVLARLPKRD